MPSSTHFDSKTLERLLAEANGKTASESQIETTDLRTDKMRAEVERLRELMMGSLNRGDSAAALALNETINDHESEILRASNEYQRRLHQNERCFQPPDRRYKLWSPPEYGRFATTEHSPVVVSPSFNEREFQRTRDRLHEMLSRAPVTPPPPSPQVRPIETSQAPRVDREPPAPVGSKPGRRAFALNGMDEV